MTSAASRQRPSPRRRAALAAFVALGTCGLAACAALGPRIAPPTVTLQEVRLDRIESLNAWFSASVTLTNPNDRELAVDAIDAALAIEGERVATASLVAPVRVPAHGTAIAGIVAHTGVDVILRAVASAMRRLGSPGAPATASPTLRYAIEGTARFAGGLQIPFRRSGELGSRPGPSP